MTHDELAESLRALRSDVALLKAESSARTTLGRYMFLCDAPLPDGRMSQVERAQAIGDLFTKDAIWEGVGDAHGAQFGRMVGSAAIVDHMTRFFSSRDPHLIFNTHYLCTESLRATSSAAEGTWVQFQPWTLDNGSSLLRSSRLLVRFASTSQGWRITNYRTENLFIADLPTGWAGQLIGEPVLWADGGGVDRSPQAVKPQCE